MGGEGKQPSQLPPDLWWYTVAGPLWDSHSTALAGARGELEKHWNPCASEFSSTGNLASDPCPPEGQGSLGTPCVLSDGVWTEDSGSSPQSIKKT